MRAHDLLKKIKEKNSQQAKKILAGTTIYEELEMDRSVFRNRPVTVIEGNAISKLLMTPEGKAVQDQTISNDVPGYIQHGKRLGITDKKVLAYFADLENQGGGGGSQRVVKAAGGANGLTLDKIHQAALKDSCLGTSAGHEGRRRNTFQKCMERLNF